MFYTCSNLQKAGEFQIRFVLQVLLSLVTSTLLHSDLKSTESSRCYKRQIKTSAFLTPTNTVGLRIVMTTEDGIEADVPTQLSPCPPDNAPPYSPYECSTVRLSNPHSERGRDFSLILHFVQNITFKPNVL